MINYVENFQENLMMSLNINLFVFVMITHIKNTIIDNNIKMEDSEVDVYNENIDENMDEKDNEFIIESWNEVIQPHIESGFPVLNKMDISSNSSFNKWCKFLKNNLK